MKDIREIKDYQIVLLGIIIAIGAIVSTFIFAHAMVSYQKLQNQSFHTPYKMIIVQKQ